MTHKKDSDPKRPKMAIISGYFGNATYGLLGPQMAATIISANTPYDCIVVAVSRDDDPRQVKKALRLYCGPQKPLVGFSGIGGREDLIKVAAGLKAEGATTILAGPQAADDFSGETGWQNHPHRFKGYKAVFNYGLKGPAEQIIPLLNNFDHQRLADIDGLLYIDNKGQVTQNRSCKWQASFLNEVNWANLYRLEKGRLAPVVISSGQVLQQIGCPYAVKTRSVDIDPPGFLADSGASPLKMELKGCSFCDVAIDKGFCGALDFDCVLTQIAGLPENRQGYKIPFELINENPFASLPRLLAAIEREGLKISQINLTTRVDYLLSGASRFKATLKKAAEMKIRLLLASVGFEAFDDILLKNLNKGVTLKDNLKAVSLMRDLKSRFPQQFGYLREEGANHGFIHPTPWDNSQNQAAQASIIAAHNLQTDIIPSNSTPLIIHHAAGLGRWARALEKEAGVTFERHGSVIGWWQVDGRFML